MFSLTPLLARHPAKHEPTPVWSLCIFRVADRASQQSVLRALHGLDREGVTALGAHRGSEHFVIVDVQSVRDKASARHVVSTRDPGAIVTFSGRKRQVLRSV